MKHVAIDLGGRESQMCVRAADGTVLKEARVWTRQLPTLVGAMEPCRVILETSSEAFRIADAARASGHEVRVVPATLVKQLGVGARGVKNDRKDARVLSEVSCRIDLPSVHIPSEQARMLKSLCGSRDVLIKSRTMVINNVRGWMRAQLIRIKGGASHTFPARLRKHAETNTVTVPEFVERQLAVIETISRQVADADKQLRTIATASSVCRQLMTAPGVGVVTAVRFVAAIDDVTRFEHAHKVQSYLGLTPGEHSSSERNRMTGITKAGSSEVRRALIQAAWTALRVSNDPMVSWAKQIAARRGKFVAVVALARKLAGILFALWRDGTSYQAHRTAVLIS